MLLLAASQIDAHMANISLIIVGAGRSSRYGGSLGKTYVSIGSKPVFLWAIDAFKDFPEIVQRLLVVAADDLAMVRRDWGTELDKRSVGLLAGGEKRFESVLAALGQVDESADLVAVHDAARPAIEVEVIREVFSKAAQTGSAIAARQVNETIKRADHAGCASHIPDRSSYWLAQTPQVFRRELLQQAYQAWPPDAPEPTDDAQVVEDFGHKAVLVPSSVENIKITTPQDLKLLRAVLEE